MLNYPKKAKISAITIALDINDIENIDQGKNSSFQRREKELDYFFIFYAKRSLL